MRGDKQRFIVDRKVLAMLALTGIEQGWGQRDKLALGQQIHCDCGKTHTVGTWELSPQWKLALTGDVMNALDQHLVRDEAPGGHAPLLFGPDGETPVA